MNTPNKTNDIDALIADENDPKQRAFLIIMSSINNSLMASAGLIKDVSGKLETHIVKYDVRTEKDDALLNKGKGIWIVAAWAAGLIQITGIAFFMQLKDEIKSLNEYAIFNKATNVLQQAEIKSLADSLRAKP